MLQRLNEGGEGFAAPLVVGELVVAGARRREEQHVPLARPSRGRAHRRLQRVAAECTGSVGKGRRGGADRIEPGQPGCQVAHRREVDLLVVAAGDQVDPARIGERPDRKQGGVGRGALRVVVAAHAAARAHVLQPVRQGAEAREAPHQRGAVRRGARAADRRLGGEHREARVPTLVLAGHLGQVDRGEQCVELGVARPGACLPPRGAAGARHVGGGSGLLAVVHGHEGVARPLCRADGGLAHRVVAERAVPVDVVGRQVREHRDRGGPGRQPRKPRTLTEPPEHRAREFEHREACLRARRAEQRSADVPPERGRSRRLVEDRGDHARGAALAGAPRDADGAVAVEGVHRQPDLRRHRRSRPARRQDEPVFPGRRHRRVGDDQVGR